jgi:plastocyanin
VRKALFFLGLAAGFALGSPVALAANQTVGADFSNTFSPSVVTVNPGDMVTWNNTGGFHNVHFVDNSYIQPPSAQNAPWTVMRTFSLPPGTYRYYCDLHGASSGTGMSGAVVVAAGYQRPQSASPLNVSLVPAFRQAGTGANPTNGQHSPPLGTPATLPPKQNSNISAVGSQNTGNASMTVVPGNQVTAADEADISYSGSITDVRAINATGVDYNPNAAGPDLTLLTRARLSDLQNGPPTGSAGTTTDLDLPGVPIDCVSTGGPEGSNCNLATSADAILAGAVVEAKQTVVQVFRVRVNDSGADGVRGNADDVLFAQQGIYIP